MKKLIYFIILVFGISCTVEGPEGPAGQDGLNSNVKTEIYKIPKSDWKFHNDEAPWFWGVEVQSDLLTEDVIIYGSHTLYFQSYDSVWMALPYSYIGVSFAPNRFGIWTEYLFNYDTTTFKLVVTELNWS